MKEFKRFIQNRLVASVVIATLAIIVASILLVTVTLQGVPKSLFGFVDPAPAEIPANVNIAGWASFDKDSYLIGDIVRYRIRILWRNNIISPDIETLKNSVAFFPLSRRDVLENTHELGGNVSEYELEYILQAVDVVPSTGYTLPSPVVYYTFEQTGARELQSYLIVSPPLHVGSYYPRDVSEIPLLDLRGYVSDPQLLRQSIMFFFSIAVLLFGFILVRYFGQKRHVNKLSEPERLWRDFHGYDRSSVDNRTFLLHCEQIFTRLLHYKTGISPMQFWAGRNPEVDLFWKDLSIKIRELLTHSYLRTVPEQSDIEIMVSYLNEIFSLMVEEQRMHREEEPSMLVRLQKQPYVFVTSGVLLALSVMLAVVAARPSAWLSPEITRYNELVTEISDELTLHSGYEQLTVLADQAKDARVKSAAYYNVGTLATNPRLSRIDPAHHEALLKVMFQEQRIFLHSLLHTLDIDDEFALISILTDTVRRLTQGETAMKTAIRISPYSDDIQRNLELLGKRRKAFADTIRGLLQEEDDSGMGEVMSQTLIDIEAMMEMEMPDEYAEMEQEGKDDKGYFIMERF